MQSEMYDDTSLIERAILAIEWSPDATKLAVASFGVDTLRAYKDIKLQIFDTVTNRIIVELQLSSPIYGCA